MNTAILPGHIGTGPEAIAARIADLLNDARKNPDGLRFDDSYLRATLIDIVCARAPLRLLLPTFHGKCPSRRLTIGDLPDYGEYLAVETLADLHAQIADIYPDTKLLLLSEGHFHADYNLLGTDQAVDDYANRIRDLLSAHPGLVFHGADDLLPKLSRDEQRQILLDDYSPDEAEMRCLMLADEQLLGLYQAYTKLHLKLITDHPDETTSGRQQRMLAKQRALLQLRKYLGFAQLLRSAFGHLAYVKLSALYKSPAQVDQVGINVIKGNHQRGTTSFYAVCRTRAGVHRMVSAADAHTAGHRLVNDHAYPYFEEVVTSCAGTTSFSTSTE
ncbi:L-tyrosine/L-tryptophan isonitrile synthase family protein [Mycobacterium simiae]|uniref:L-tyrosine/L-tryptophan isonitrile synthase family protein n=1 Tax=Mycobacterium simiae TaxID=1784 RepID=A0A5B1BF00_MYCSI|nr:L-tyrosine/L-tryptophan isonitrile synthase family protein [Mycobacterium simiae]KAA1245679.1 L-tyrosine/L-tryptophan isonitrile synthase family protein [Mycobacterium simiae]